MRTRFLLATALGLGITALLLDGRALATPQCVAVAAAQLAIESVTVDGVPVTDLSGYQSLDWSLGGTVGPRPGVAALVISARLRQGGTSVLSQTYVP